MIAVAFWVPSGCGIAVMARYELSLMLESGTLTTSFTGPFSASLIFISTPSRDFAVIIEPSTLSIVARTRTTCGACAAAMEAAKSAANAVAPKILRVIVVMKSSQSAPAVSPRRIIFTTPERQRYSGASAGGRVQIGFEQCPQLRRDFGLLAEPQRKAADGLMQQHAEPVGGTQAAGFRRTDQWRAHRHINQIGDHGVTGQPPHIGRKFRLPGHAERRRIDEQRRAAELIVQFVPARDPHTVAETPAQGVGPARRPVDDDDALRAA